MFEKLCSVLPLFTIVCLLLCPAAVSAQAVEYYHLDAIGSVRVVTDHTGVVIERHDYLPFGDEVTPPPVTQSRQFTGKERDAETGLDYFGARYYSAKRGRFTTVDPLYTWQENLVDPQRWNRYAYARNNPLRFTDPDGRAIETVLDVVALAASIRAVYNDPGSISNWVAAGVDAISVAAPGIPALGGSALRTAIAADRAREIHAPSANVEKITEATRLLAERAGPVGHISPTEVIGRTPTQIAQRAKELGLEAKGPNAAAGRGAYIDPQTGVQRILVHPSSDLPHGHVNNPAGQRVGPTGDAVGRTTPAAHLPIKKE